MTRFLLFFTISAYGEWTRAREADDFDGFAPTLREVFDLQKEIYSVSKPDMELYDAAIDSYDPKMRADRISEIFDEVKKELTPLIKDIAAKVTSKPWTLNPRSHSPFQGYRP